MEHNQARWLLENLLDRLTERNDGKKEITGVITEAEQQALEAAVKALGGETAKPVDDEEFGQKIPSEKKGGLLPPPVVSPPIEEPDIEVVGPSIKVPEIELDDISPDYRICIDFGTAMSKVTFVHDGERDDGGDIIEVLPLGEIAGQDPIDGGPELLISSVYIGNDGKVYFGKSALEVSDQEADEDDARKRVDNIKRFLSEDGIDDFLVEVFNPTKLDITFKDILFYYLVYLTWVIGKCVKDLDESYDTALLRRYAMPCFDNGKANEYARLLSDLLGGAYVAMVGLEHNGFLNEEMENPFHEGIPLSDLKAVCDVALSQNDQYPFVDFAITEPLGVASALISEDGKANNLSMVIDIGAGTTDISMFRIRVDPEHDNFVALQIPGATAGFSMAGNYIDRVLTHKVLSLAGVTSQTINYRRIYNALERNIRRYKEDLFNDGNVDVTLIDGNVVEVTLEQVMESSSIQRFQQALQNTIVEILERAPKHYLENAPRHELAIVLTGGGATLPFAQNVIGWELEVNGVSIKTVPARPCPEWIEEDYPELIDSFSRIAVSLGGARQNVIQPHGQ
ncbi:hypothetical protein [Vreelandella neptunia]|uniref:Uncharacterized protein n=1 Tax=Vreelandella neptunia TaxID=115551 RepID=A0ABZ0YI32_9GAMM|nr:hypothetical protein [Halomonas neptunia]MDN3562398.1 hypothetical protein [Halomonas neptunia]WQH11772.1 hypothetical protein SR894_16650 [Halomonas neptunia]